MAEPASPFKFLNYYTTDDRDIFFGREKEIRILLSDIVVNRLVVLFARTGTGKTSIINAGVRPRLEERGYETFFIRVNRDPVDSARAELARHLPLERSQQPFPVWLESVAARLQRPILLCFDQFEEFFIHSFDRRSGRGREFIADVAELFNNQASRVHLLFSMREEWFVWMDEFRDEIPSIFHAESSLRLRWFDATQAKDAIIRPPRAFGVEIDSDLAEQIVAQLDRGDGIEPAQLQVVCDTLWRGRHSDARTIGMDDYRRLGLDAAGSEVAARVLYDRFDSDFAALDSRADFDLLRRLLPELRTPREPYTKYVRDIPGLASTLGITEQALMRLVDRLESFRFVRKGLRDELVTIELTHDYLIEHFDMLDRRIRGLWPRRLINAARQEQRLATAEEIEIVSDTADVLVLDRADTELLLRSTLEMGNRVPQWFSRALELGIDAWQIVRDRLKGTPPAYATVRALAQIGGATSIDLLREATSDPKLAGSAIEALTDFNTVAAVETLRETLSRTDLRAQAQVALGWMVASRAPDVAAAAGSALEEAKKEDVKARESTAPATAASQAPARFEPTRIRPTESVSGKVPTAAIAEQLASGRVIPVLGPGVATAGREGRHWSPGGEIVPTHAELGAHLLEKVLLEAVPGTLDLATIASLFSMMMSRHELTNEIRRIYESAREPNLISRELAAVNSPMVVVTTMFDTSIERSFLERERPFHVVVHQQDERRTNRIGWFRPGATRAEIVEPNRLLIDENESILYKVCGSVDTNEASMFITEEDLIDLTSRLVMGGIPPAVMMRIRTCRLLFIGYPVDNWFPRSLLRAMTSGFSDRLGEAWAVSVYPSPLDQLVWSRWSVKHYDADPVAFVEELRRFAERSA